MPRKRKPKSLQTVPVETFRSHDKADNGLASLVGKLSLTPNDPGYKQKVKPFLQTLNPAKVKDVKKLVADFIGNGMTKDTFKDKWRDLQPGTDEHFSTQSVYTMLDTIRSNRNKSLAKSSVNLDVLGETLSVISHFRFPTEYTGHSSGGYELGHPRGKKESPYILSDDAPSHSTFDMYRRTQAVRVGEEYHANNRNDGTGTLVSMLTEAATFTINIVATPLASDVTLVRTISGTTKKNISDDREQLKEDLRTLNNTPGSQTQAENSPQFSQFSSPAEKAIKTVANRQRARSLSPARRATPPPTLKATSTPMLKRKQPASPFADTTAAPQASQSSSGPSFVTSRQTLRQRLSPQPTSPLGDAMIIDTVSG